MSTPHTVLSITHDEPARTVYARVHSGRSGREYIVVSIKGESDHCGCEAGQRTFPCSHVRAVREYLSTPSPATGAGPTPALHAAPSPAPVPPLASPSCPADIPDNATDECIAVWDAWKGCDVRERMRRTVYQFFAWQSRQEAREARRARMADTAAGLVVGVGGGSK